MSAIQIDKYFDVFLKDFGPPSNQVPIAETISSAYRHRLPEQLFVYWRALGACSFRDGLFWMTNPEEYEDLLDSWLEGTPFEHRTDLSVIARTAFGKLYIWGSGRGVVFTIRPLSNLIGHYSEKDRVQLSPAQETRELQQFWAFTSEENVDQLDGTDKPLFARALKKFGPLKPDEMYGYSLRPALGGKESITNLGIVKLHVYHDIAQQMEEPTLIDIS